MSVPVLELEKLLNYLELTASPGVVSEVIKSIDAYCWKYSTRMSNIGDEKGLILDNAIIKYSPKLVLELGTFIGYSALRMVQNLPPDAHIYTIEPNPTHIKYAQKIINYAGLTDRITILNGILETQINDIKNKHSINSFDCVFIDHEKSVYLPDLLLLEKTNLIKKGTVLIADNILYPGSPEYKKYVLENDKKYTTIIHNTKLEYNNSIDDQVLESIVL